MVAANNLFPISVVNKIYYTHYNKFVNKSLFMSDKSDSPSYFLILFFDPISLQIKNLFKFYSIKICTPLDNC